MGSLVGGIATCNMGSRSFEKSKEAWSSLVYNKDITQSEVLDAYKDWAVTYENDLLALHPDRAQHMATYLRDLCRAERYDISTIVALDYCQEILDIAKEKEVDGKAVYEDFICAPFGNTIPDGMRARSFDCVIMLGGFAAGHLPLSSLHTMARMCRRNGFVINSMTLQYSHFVDEYKHIDEYVKELESDRVWNIKFKKVLDNYIKGKQGLVHAMQVC